MTHRGSYSYVPAKVTTNEEEVAGFDMTFREGDTYRQGVCVCCLLVTLIIRDA